MIAMLHRFRLNMQNSQNHRSLGTFFRNCRKQDLWRLSQSFVQPSEPTPSETLKLSVIDRVPGLRHPVRSLHVFRHGQEPARVIRQALAKALVSYYPFAGRFVHGAEGGELVVDCTGEGVWFVEAKANCRLENVKYLDLPLMISQEELLPQACSEFETLDVPAMLQVTEFECGGFVVGFISVHTIADGLGAAQFINAVAERARDQSQPTTTPLWSRNLIPVPRKLPAGPPPVFPSYKLQYSTFDLPVDYISQIKASYLEATGSRCSSFDISTAKAWQARTRAINLAPEDLVHLCFFASTRHLLTPKLLPKEGGFYGNCFYPVTVTAASGTVANAGTVDVVRIVRDAKARLPSEFENWAKGEFKKDPYELGFAYDSLFVSDWTRLGFLEVDYGWGTPVHVMPFAYYSFMAVAIFGVPVAPKKGVRVMTQCVEKEHLPALEEHMKILK